MLAKTAAKVCFISILQTSFNSGNMSILSILYMTYYISSSQSLNEIDFNTILV